jgi:SNF2 family DNA or RNA helicase
MPTLRPYQLEDVQKLKNLNTFALFNEQRTGKTPTVLTILKEKNCTKNLIICPASAIYQWQEEYETWLQKPCIILDKTKYKTEYMDAYWTNGLVVSYDTFKETTRSEGIVKYALKLFPDAIILDEAHRIKNPKSANAKAVFKTLKIPVRVALTGTPAPNKPEEIYSILHWLYPDKFKSYWGFIDYYFNKLTGYGTGGRTYIDIRGFQTGKDIILQTFLDKISTQRKRKEVMPWLPDKDYQQIKLPATTAQLKYLNELQQYFTTEGIQVQGILDRLIRYRQICLHPGLLNLKGNSPKLDWLKTYLDNNPDKPVIVFSKFTSFLKILDTELLEKKGLIIGDTPIEKRNQLKLDFQCGKINLLLINTDAGKEALTLDRAEVAIFTDKYPPIGDILQAEDRFIATTEDKKDKPHTIIELMIKDTYDEQLYKLIEQRKSSVDIINDYKKYLKGV